MHFATEADAGHVDAEGALLWRVFVGGRDPGARARLIDRYMRFARIMAAKLYAGRPFGGVEFDDYLQFAHVGMIEAVDRYDPGHGAKFETFAAPRIRGAILSGIESASDVHGQVSARRRLLASRVSSLSESAAAAGTPEQVFAALADVAIGLAVGFALDETGMYRSEESEFVERGYAALEMKQIKLRALGLLATLPGNEKAVIEYHYLQQIAFDQIAAILGLSAGRIAQIHKQALARLRAGFKEAGVLSLSC